MTNLQSSIYNQDSNLPRARFTGIFIPVEILNIPNLTPTDIILLSWIDALYDEEHGGCFATNDYLSKKLHLKEKTVSDIISKLIHLGLVEKVSFNGRIRVMKACKERWYQPEADSGLNRRQSPVKTGSRPRLEPEPHLIYSKEESKDIYKEKIHPKKSKKITKESVPRIKRRPLVETSEEEHADLEKKLGKEVLDKCYDHLQEWKVSKSEIDPRAVDNHTDRYRITRWVVKAVQEGDIKKKVSEDKQWEKINRDLFFMLKEKYPSELKNSIYSNGFVINKDNGKDVSTSMNPELFKPILANVVGGEIYG